MSEHERLEELANRARKQGESGSMTNYEYLTYRREYAEERCREAQDSHVKTFWAKMADQAAIKAKSLTVEEAAQRFDPFF